MANCKLTKSLNGKACDYHLSGVETAFLLNYYPPVVGSASVVGSIAYEFDENDVITGIFPPTGETFFELKNEENTLSFSDELFEGANLAKYRQHTFNGILNQLDVDVLNQGDALSLGKFVVVVKDNAGRILVLGRTNGLKAPAGGFNYASGTASADSAAWTLILQGVSKEISKMVESIAVVTPIWAD